MMPSISATRPGVRPRRERPLDPDEQEVGRRTRATTDRTAPSRYLVGKKRLDALGDELAEPAEGVAEDRGHRREADRRDDREPDAGDDQRHGQRQLDPEQPLAAGVAHALGRLEDVGRDGGEPGGECSGTGSAACRSSAG